MTWQNCFAIAGVFAFVAFTAIGGEQLQAAQSAEMVAKAIPS